MSVPDPPNISRNPFASAGALEFEWQPPTNTNGPITGYRLFVGATEILLDSTARYYKATGLSNGTTYTCSLEAANANGYSTKAYFRDFEPGSAPTVGPASVTVSVPNFSTAVVSWTPPASLPDATIQWYAVYAEGLTSTISRSAIANLHSSRTMQNLTNPFSYNYSVRAVNCPGWSPSTTVSIAAPANARWATKIGGTGAEGGDTIKHNIATDSTGNVYVAGYYSSSPVTISNFSSSPVGGGTVGISTYGTLANSGSTDIFLIKYDISGTALWATKIAGTGADREPCLATDSNGNLYITAMFSGTATISNYNSAPSGGGAVGLATYGTLTSAGGYESCIVKYNSSGVAQWATKLGGTGDEYAPYITTDTLGNICIVSQFFSTTLTISNYNSAPVSGGAVGLATYGTLTNTNSTAHDTYIIKYNSSGAAQWATRIGGTLNEGSPVVVTDYSNNVYVVISSTSTTITAYSYSSAPSGGGSVGVAAYGTFSNASSPGNDTIIIKYNSSGVIQWGTQIGGATSQWTANAVVDSNNNLYIIEQLDATATVYNYTSAPVAAGAVGLTAYGTIPTAGGVDICIIKYNSSGSVIWATKMGGTLADQRPQIAIDAYDNIYAAIHFFSAPLTISNYSSAPVSGGAFGFTTYGTLTNGSTSTSFSDVALVKYNSSGAAQWATRVSGDNSESHGSIAVNTLINAIYLTGSYASAPASISNYSTAPSGGGAVGLTTYGTIANAGTAGTYDTFLIRYDL